MNYRITLQSEQASLNPLVIADKDMASVVFKKLVRSYSEAVQTVLKGTVSMDNDFFCETEIYLFDDNAVMTMFRTRSEPTKDGIATGVLYPLDRRLAVNYGGLEAIKWEPLEPMKDPTDHLFRAVLSFPPEEENYFRAILLYLRDVVKEMGVCVVDTVKEIFEVLGNVIRFVGEKYGLNK
jgi:hypothetical protein